MAEPEKKDPCNLNSEMFVLKVGNPCPTLGQLLASRILYALLVGEKQYEIAQARFCTRSCSKVGQLLVNSSPTPHPMGSCRGLPCSSPLATPEGGGKCRFYCHGRGGVSESFAVPRGRGCREENWWEVWGGAKHDLSGSGGLGPLIASSNRITFFVYRTPIPLYRSKRPIAPFLPCTKFHVSHPSSCPQKGIAIYPCIAAIVTPIAV